MRKLLLIAFLSPSCLASEAPWSRADLAAFASAEANAPLAAEGLERAHRFVLGWLPHADPTTGLFPQRFRPPRIDVWNAHNCAADCYPFMVLSCALTDRPLLDGRMRQVLATEQRLTNRLDRLPDSWSLTKQAFEHEEPDLGRMLFGAAEYVKDGLLSVAELIADGSWNERMIGLVDDIWKHAPVQTRWGRLPDAGHEVNGDVMIAVARLAWMTGRPDYRQYAFRLGDHFLLGDQHPTRDSDNLRLRDHGCEVTAGLAEVYALASYASPEKAAVWRAPLYEMFDRLLEVGRLPDGMMYDRINPKTGQVLDRHVCDNWGYNYNAIYTLYLLDGTGTAPERPRAYREAVRHALRGVLAYRNYSWEGNRSPDGFADSIESAIYLHRYEPTPEVAEWLDGETRILFDMQDDDGITTGFYHDGNVARTTLLYALWKSAGVRAEPWRADVQVGGHVRGDALYVHVSAARPWSGKLLFDRPRHRDFMRLPLDYPRINAFPEWYAVDAGKRYQLARDGETARTLDGGELIAGLALAVDANPVKLRIHPTP
ncbi:hypothetical protein HS125_07290 [bacterium]|nr:hypothetical protein [bacterium]